LHVYLGILQVIVSGVRMFVDGVRMLMRCGSVFVGFGLLLVVSDWMSVRSGRRLSADFADYAEEEIGAEETQSG